VGANNLKKGRKMVYRYDQILKKEKNKLFMIGIALVFAMTLMVGVFSAMV